MDNNEIVLSEEIQKRMLKFFLKTSIPRKAKQERAKKPCLKKCSKRKNKSYVKDSDIRSSFDRRSRLCTFIQLEGCL